MPGLPPQARLGLGCLAAAAAAPVAWSMLTETVLPLWRAGAYAEMGLNLAGLPLILLGVGAFAWGGVLLAVRTNDLRTLGRLWRRPLAWLAGGFGLIALGSVIINWLPGALGLR